MTHLIKADERHVISFAPATLLDEVLQNVTMIISTIKTTVPLFRDFGISSVFLDKTIIAAEAILVAEILDAIEAYEPRANIINVYFNRDGIIGKLIPVLEVGVNAE